MGGQSKKRNNSKKKPKKKTDCGFVHLSTQERMKIKMHEKAKRKTAQKYSVDQLLEKTEECLDNFNFEMAQMFCQRALDLEPTNLRILDMLGNICAELGNGEKAKQIFLHAAELSPDEGHAKYMYLGQINSGDEAVRYFMKGIEVMINAYQKQSQAAAAASNLDNPEVTSKDISTAFCSVAEIFFTDLCMEDGASDKCKEAIKKALEYDPNNPEALQLMASYLFSAEQPQEGKEFLMKSLEVWLPSLHEKERQLSCQEAEDVHLLQNQFPPYESRITTAKLLVETEEYEDVLIKMQKGTNQHLPLSYYATHRFSLPLYFTPSMQVYLLPLVQLATEVLEGLLEEDDEVVQVWYLLGWVCYLQTEKCDEGEAFKDSARTYLTKAKKLYVKLKCDDSQLLEHTEQLLAELGPGAGPQDLDDDELPLENIGDDFVPSSEDEAMEQ
ncbi:uncharacterized protein SI:DKEY-12J5.1 isoform X2 [Latimeria chalumnae]|uniref:uncharacterized protein SI:DKEY-12J5.1 isoform X2 n=1 Tax=Latimeria chalumnae TaxID=7897 RepID=UPI00313D2961